VASTRDLAIELEVPMGDVARALMKLGLIKSATVELTADEANFVRADLAGGSSPPRECDAGG
jgi:hypothetical protein